jgi:hypothetical protein
MLEELRDYPRNLANYYFADYSEGIIAGVDLSIVDKSIRISEGIIKFNDLIYLLNEPITVDYTNNDEATVIKACFTESAEQEGLQVCGSEVVLDNQLSLEEDEFELGRFKLRTGARLKDSYNDFKDFDIEYNTLNLINVKYAAPGGATLHPDIVTKFAEIIYNNSEQVIDDIFAAQCLNSRVVSRQLLLNYITRRLDVAKKNYNNRELYDFLKQILNSLSFTTPQPEEKPKRQKIIVD